MKYKNLYKLLFLLISLFLYLGTPVHSFAQGWYSSGWSYRKSVTVNSGQVPSAQSNFPVAVNLASDAGLAAHARSDGFDILFTTSDGITQIPYERERYVSGTGALVAWVKVPSISVGTVIYMYYGNSGASDQQDITHAVWDANYKLVYHLGDASSPALDGTTNANNGTQSGGVTFGVTGKVGIATQYASNSTTDQNISPGSSPGISGITSFTYEVWINISSYTNNTSMTAADGSYFIDRTAATAGNPLASLIAVGSRFGFQVRYDDGTGLGGPNPTSGSTITTGTWYHVVMVRDVSNNLFRLYANGTQLATTASNNTLSLAPSIPKLGHHATFIVAGRGLNGYLDEFRISDIARSANWITTEYNNQNNPGAFYTLSAEQTCLTPTITSGVTNVTCNGGTNGAVSITLTGGTSPFTFLWSNGMTTQNITNLYAGTYTVTVTSNPGCSASSGSSLSQPAALTTSVTVESPVSCFGGHDGSVTIQGIGGTPPFQYSVTNGAPWSPAIPTSGSYPFTGLDANTPYRIRAIDSNGCMSPAVP